MLDLSNATVSDLSALHAFYVRAEALTAEFIGQPRGSKGMARRALDDHGRQACDRAEEVAAEAARRTPRSEVEADMLKVIAAQHAIFNGDYHRISASSEPVA